ncbi:MAG: hypothetical protein CVU56_23800 [Deltaproteobacteria bacterium HGW-Deltaproteobacteria-14]|jgi:flavin-dependent dehydrogenase|nr:MAG: hypothetical protein CVU56_23800 [Deltaproteobacteria bacterium HGW-Deltaproteobacteria-14]
MERTVDYLIIGAGIAGTVLERYLRHLDVAIVDPHPGGYRIGESIIPSFFNGHLLREEVLPGARRLPSYSRKDGTTFVGRDSVAAFPVAPEDRALSMHVARHEFDAHLHASLGTPVLKERVVDVDVANHIVRTEKTTFRVRRQIVDCSGQAMVVGRSTATVDDLFPMFARWGYYDVTKVAPERFAADVAASGKAYLEYDLGECRVRESDRSAPWDVSHSSILTQLGDGLWSWQIALYDRTVLSFGVVSRSGPVAVDALDELAMTTHSPVFELARRTASRGDAFSRDHVRNNFARRASPVATMDYILLADAAMFADPIYSTGTGFAAMSAVELAWLLEGDGWTEEKCASYLERYDRTMSMALDAFDTWYRDELLHADAAAAPAVQDVLQGTLFQRTLLTGYRGAMTAAERIDRVGEYELEVQRRGGGWPFAK